MHARRPVGVVVKVDDVAPLVAVDVTRDEARLVYVEEGWGRGPVSREAAALRREAPAGVELEDVDLDRAVVVLIDHRDLVGAGRPRELAGDEARLRGPDLIRP